MKKLLSILLCVVMLFSLVVTNAVSASAAVARTTTPTVRIITNDGSPVADGFETYFCVRFDNFISIKGIDVTIKAEGATITNVQTVGLNPAVDDIASADENYDIVEDGTTVHFVDFNKEPKSRIIVKAKAPTKTASVTVTGDYAHDGTNLFKVTAPLDGSFEIKEAVEVKSATGETLTQPAASTGTFIPQSGVYKYENNKYTFAEKDENGAFDVSEGGYSYTTFNLPRTGTDSITPFGVSTQLDGDALLFGNYSEYDNISDAQHGTLVVEGNWIALKEYYIRMGYSVQECLESLYKDVSAKISPDEGKYHVTYKVKYGDDLQKITKVNVYKFPRKNYLWRDNAGKLEYGIRLHGVDATKSYTCAAYCEAGEDVYISHNVKAYYKAATEEPGQGGDSSDNSSDTSSETPSTPDTTEETNMGEDILENGTLTPGMAKGTLYGVDLNASNLVNDHAHRLYTKSTFVVANCQSITFPENTKGWVQYYDETGANIGSSGYWATGTYKPLSTVGGKTAVYFKITFTNSDDNATPTGNINITYTGDPIKTDDPVTEGETIYPQMMQANLYKNSETGELVVQTTSTNRICTAETYNIADYESITVATGYRANIVFLNADGSFHHNQAWLPAGTHTISTYAGTASTLFRVVISTDPDSDPFKLATYNEAGGNGLALTKAAN